MLVALKILDIRSVMVYIKQRTTDSWLGVASPISILTLPKKLL